MTKNRFLTLFALVCLCPVVLAFLLLQSSARQTATTNQGQWFSEELQLLEPVSGGAAHWRLAYVVADHCAADCQQTLQLMQNIDLALGRKNNQLDLVVLSNQQLASGWQASPAGAATVLTTGVQLQPLKLASERFAHQLVLVAPQGIALLRYPLPSDPQYLPLVGKALLADLQKLLKFDRGPV